MFFFVSHLGTLLASGSDDLQVIVWNWDLNQIALAYDTNHRSNVFQVRRHSVQINSKRVFRQNLSRFQTIVKSLVVHVMDKFVWLN